MMKQYDSYKDSGVEWIGKIPSHWETLPLKRYGRFGKGLSFTKADLVDEGYPVISYGQIHSKHNSCTGNNDELIRFVPGVFIDHADNSIVSMGDFIFADTSEDLEGSGNAVYIDRDSDIYGGYHTIIFQTKNKDNKYLAYLFKTDYWRSQIRSRVSGVKVYSITQSILNLVSIILPPYEEQYAISTYLDKKCGKIDKAIATQEKRVELLKELRQNIITQAVTRGINPNAPLKNSGVEWIGEVPDHWEVMKMGLVCNVITDYVASGSFANLKKNVEYLDMPDYAMLVRTADLSNKNRDIQRVYVSKDAYKFLSNSNLYGGEIILPNIGASIGDVYMVPGDLYEKMTLAPNSIMVKTNYFDLYFYYYFSSICGRKSLELIGLAAAQGKFNKTELRQMRVPVPPLSEQQEIVSYIESKTARLDASIEKAEHQIELLQELKQSIITEVVTGKRKVV